MNIFRYHVSHINISPFPSRLELIYFLILKLLDLTRDARAGIEVMVAHGVGVGVRYPSHLPLPCPHVRGRDVDESAQQL